MSRLSKISDLPPASLELNFLMEREAGSCGRGSCQEIPDLATGQRDAATATGGVRDQAQVVGRSNTKG